MQGVVDALGDFHGHPPQWPGTGDDYVTCPRCRRSALLHVAQGSPDLRGVCAGGAAMNPSQAGLMEVDDAPEIQNLSAD